jgi:hypothetical protein
VYIAAWAIMAAALRRTLTLGAGSLRAALRPSAVGPSDATVTILRVHVAPRGRGESSVTTLIANPGPCPALAGLSVSRQRVPAWLGGDARARIARRTARRRYRADRQATIGIISANGIGVLTVHFTAIRGRYRIVALIGQPDHRLQVTSMPLVARGGKNSRSRGAALTDLFPWLT